MLSRKRLPLWRRPGLLIGGALAGAFAVSGLGTAAGRDAARPFPLDRVPSPEYPAPPPRSLSTEHERAVRDVAPALTALLGLDAAEFAQLDPEFLDYYTRHLQPRIDRPWTLLAPEDVFDIDFDRDGVNELVLVGTWRDAFFVHDLWFVAVLEQTPQRRFRVVVFERTSAPIAALGKLDLDGDTVPEVVVLTQLGIARNGAPSHAIVVSGSRAGWRLASLPGGDSIDVVDTDGTWTFVSTRVGDAEPVRKAFRWTQGGFVSASAD